jgi:iron complex outermembrane receptor protein
MHRLSRWGRGLLLLGAAAPAAADEPVRLERVEVLGVRASLESARARKRTAIDLLDAVVAAEIHKLPELNLGDAVQRVSGVQITRDRGEGSIVSVRGLTQVESTLNGREIFTAGTGRTLDFADFAAESVAGIDVHKSASAERIEGGIGGTIDLRTRRPFDFGGTRRVLSLRAQHGDLVDRGGGQVSALASGRWAIAGGEVGALLNLIALDRSWREDQKGTGNPLLRTDLVPGQTVVAPNGTSETISTGRRRRGGASLVLEGRFDGGLEWLAEAHWAQLKTIQDSHQINVTAGPGVVPGSVTLFPGTNDLRSVTWTDAPLSVLSFARDTVDRTRQLAAGARWRGERLVLSGDLSHTRSLNRLFFAGPILAGSAAQFSHDLGGTLPATAVSGTDLLDPAALRIVGLTYRVRPFEGALTAARLDAEWSPAGAGPVDRVAIGWRGARRRADNSPGLIFGDIALAAVPAAARPDAVMPRPDDDFLAGRAPSLGGFLVGNLAGARDPAGQRASYGITAPLPEAGNPLGVWRIDERSDALYLRADGRASTLEGAAGLRVVHTRTLTHGTRSDPIGGSVVPIAERGASTDVLPSLNLRWIAAPGLLLRAAASRTLTRPDFNQLSPSLSLLRNPVNEALNQGSAGNPALRPVRARNLDLAIEHYGGPTASAALTLFWKRVDGFIATSSQPEVVDGVTYLVSRPRNLDRARIRGAELAFQRFFDGLPGAWRGLGVQANYTYVDSAAPDRLLGREVPLQNLSRHSANLIGMYEHGPWSARLAANWRDRFQSGTTSVVGLGVLPVTTRAYGWLDASLRYRVDPRISLAVEGGNLLRTLRTATLESATRPQQAWLNDRQFAVTATLQF